MRSSWTEPYLWVHLAGLAAVPIFLELCLVGLAASQTVLQAGIGFLLVALIGILPIFWMQWHRPFNIFSLVALSLKPSELTEMQRRILQQFKTPVAKAVAVIMAILAFLILWQLNQWLLLNTPMVKVPGGWFGGLLLAAVAFLLSNLFLQVPASVLMVLLTPERQFAAASPYPVAQIPADFTLLGLQVKQILPPIAIAPVASAPVAPTPASKNAPIAEGAKAKAAKAKAAQLEIASLEITEPEIPQSDGTQLEIPQADVTSPDIIEPEISQSEISQSEISQPEVTQPDITEPEITQAQVTQLETVQAEIPQAEVTQPDIIEPEVTQPEMGQLETAQPAISPAITEPQILQDEEPNSANSVPDSEPEQADLSIPVINVDSGWQETLKKAVAAIRRRAPQAADTVVTITPPGEATSATTPDLTENEFAETEAEPSAPALPTVTDTIVTIGLPKTAATQPEEPLP